MPPQQLLQQPPIAPKHLPKHEPIPPQQRPHMSRVPPQHDIKPPQQPEMQPGTPKMHFLQPPPSIVTQPKRAAPSKPIGAQRHMPSPAKHFFNRPHTDLHASPSQRQHRPQHVFGRGGFFAGVVVVVVVEDEAAAAAPLAAEAGVSFEPSFIFPFAPPPTPSRGVEGLLLVVLRGEESGVPSSERGVESGVDERPPSSSSLSSSSQQPQHEQQVPLLVHEQQKSASMRAPKKARRQRLMASQQRANGARHGTLQHGVSMGAGLFDGLGKQHAGRHRLRQRPKHRWGL